MGADNQAERVLTRLREDRNLALEILKRNNIDREKAETILNDLEREGFIVRRVHYPT